MSASVSAPQSAGQTSSAPLAGLFAPSERTLPKMLARQAERYAMRRLVAIDLPVTTTLAHRAGREIWGYNKFVAPIDLQGDGKTFSTTLRDPDNAVILVLEGARTASIPTPPADVPTFSMLGGRAIRTIIRPMTPFQTSSGEGFLLKVGKSDHPMAANLRTLALDEARPALVQYANPLQFLLFPGGVL